jgi:hypothetical protein
MESKWGYVRAPVLRLAKRLQGRGDAFLLEPALDVKLQGAVDDRLGRDRCPWRALGPIPSDNWPMTRDGYERPQSGPAVERLSTGRGEQVNDVVVEVKERAQGGGINATVGERGR